MTTIAFNIVPPKLMEASQTEQYVVSNPQADIVKVAIDVCTVTNIGGQSATFNFNLVPNGGVAGISNLLINQKRLDPGESYLCLELLGQILEESASISTLASVANTLSFSISGREITL